MSFLLRPPPRTEDPRDIANWLVELYHKLRLDSAIAWSNVDKTGFVPGDLPAIAHSILTGLLVDDHTQYIHTNGSRQGAVSQAQSFGTNGIKTDSILESSSGSGVTIDSALLKDGGIQIGAFKMSTGATAGYFLKSDANGIGTWATAGVITDHGGLTGLGDDDHTQYLLATGTRAGASSQAQSFGANGVKADKVDESTADTGVTVETVLIKDGNITMGDGKTIGQAAGPLIAFDDTNNYLEVTGCNVGIGTTSPAELLHVYKSSSTVHANAQIENAGGNLAELSIKSNSNEFLFQVGGTNNSGNAKLYIANNAGVSAVIDASGNVGIGTTSPSNKFHVEDGTLNTAAAYINQTNGGDLLVLAADGSEKVRVQHGGNVGIGTGSPTALLDVNSDKIRVRTSKTPASASATGNAGDICWDADYVYVCVATDTWKRAALSSW